MNDGEKALELIQRIVQIKDEEVLYLYLIFIAPPKKPFEELAKIDGTLNSGALNNFDSAVKVHLRGQTQRLDVPVSVRVHKGNLMHVVEFLGQLGRTLTHYESGKRVFVEGSLVHIEHTKDDKTQTVQGTFVGGKFHTSYPAKDFQLAFLTRIASNT